MQTGETINIPNIKKTIEKCCRSGSGCESCEGKSCLIGFAKIVCSYADQKKMLAIPGGLNLVPKEDFKVYEVDDIACALAVISLECKNCMDNHDDNCVINIMRSSLEVALLGEHVEFKGGSLNYIIALTQIKPELGNKVMEYYNMLKNE